MPDRTEHPSLPSPRGPWPEASDERIFDYGAPWCANAAGHPGHDDDAYPDPHQHVPTDECRSSSLDLDARDGLTGARRDVEVYAARPYRFGEPRQTARTADVRIVFATFDESTGTEHRFSISRGDALRLALHLIGIVRRVDNASASPIQ